MTSLEDEKKRAEEKKLIEEEQKELDQEDFEEFKGSDDLEDDPPIADVPEHKQKGLNKSFENWTLTKAVGLNYMAKKHIQDLNIKKSKDKTSVSPQRVEPAQSTLKLSRLQTSTITGVKLGQ